MSLSSPDKMSAGNEKIKGSLSELRLEKTEVDETGPNMDILPDDMIENNIPSVKKMGKRVRYCSLCGNPIDGETKRCTGCGKQYFKGIPWKRVIAVIFSLLLVASLAVNMLSYRVLEEIVHENDDLAEKINSIQVEKKDIENELKENYKIFNEINKLVVFVEDDGTKLYHRFQCEKFKGDSFWAFNLDAAKDKGYKPCSLCHNASGTPELNFTEEVEYLLIADAVGDDYEISTTELDKLPKRELSWLMSKSVVFTCSDWKGLYHSATCERLTGMCSVGVKSIVERDGYRPCSACQD